MQRGAAAAHAREGTRPNGVSGCLRWERPRAGGAAGHDRDEHSLAVLHLQCDAGLNEHHDGSEVALTAREV